MKGCKRDERLGILQQARIIGGRGGAICETPVDYPDYGLLMAGPSWRWRRIMCLFLLLGEFIAGLTSGVIEG